MYLGHRYQRLKILNKITKIDEDPNRFWQCNAKRPSLALLFGDCWGFSSRAAPPERAEMVGLEPGIYPAWLFNIAMV